MNDDLADAEQFVWALGVLGLEPGDTADTARRRYRELLRRTHPDVSSDPTGSATDATVELTRAHRVIASMIDHHGLGVIPHPPAPIAVAAEGETCRHRGPVGPIEHIEIRADGDTISLTVPPPEAFAILLEAGARLGGIGYVDRALGLLEIIVRFEGGPSCSVLITLQGRAFGTDAFLTMESIEAAPTPDPAPVVEALLDELESLHLT
jgi:hypothetical protein